MKNHLKTAGVILALFALTGCTTPQIKSIRDVATATPAAPVASNFVVIQADSLSPDAIVVSAGDVVTFQNADAKPHQIASDPYPDDNLLPDLHSGTLYRGETYRYTFTKPGSFGYHLEDNPSIKGKVVVE